AETIDQEQVDILRDVWSEYLGVYDNPDLAIRYFVMVRDMCYARISIKNISTPLLRELIAEAKALMRRMVKSNAALQLN
ncbi:MAG TPA: hypothetical protein VKZ75_08775, partial [Cyclobacteriaceae bacterium]|nr:hypothetical protein [Cyclobacteriaceae bacterium]